MKQETTWTGLDPAAEIVTSYWIRDPESTEGLFSIESNIYESYGLYENSGIRSIFLDEDEQIAETSIMYKSNF